MLFLKLSLICLHYLSIRLLLQKSGLFVFVSMCGQKQSESATFVNKREQQLTDYIMKLHFKAAYMALTGKSPDGRAGREQKTGVFLPIALSIVLCLVIWVGGMFLTHWYAYNYFRTGPDENPPAAFGDSFGAVSALISAFAFAGVIVSMYLQRKDLELQRESLNVQQADLNRNTAELAMQKEELRTQNKIMKQQRFENTFFSMLSLQHEITSGLSLNYTEADGKDYSVAGRTVFEKIYRCALIQVNERREYGICAFIKKYGVENFLQIPQVEDFNHYFRHLYRIIRLIDETTLLETKYERYYYISNLRATLSKYELLLLFYNSLPYADFKGLIEEYSLFDNIDAGSLAVPGTDIHLYAESACNPDIKGYNRPQTQ